MIIKYLFCLLCALIARELMASLWSINFYKSLSLIDKISLNAIILIIAMIAIVKIGT